MENNAYKLVDFVEYCPKCQYEKLKEEDEPCNDCIANAVNLYSHKPIYFKEKE